MHSGSPKDTVAADLGRLLQPWLNLQKWKKKSILSDFK